MNLKDLLLLLELKWKFIIKWKCYDLEETKEFFEMHISYNYKVWKIFVNQSEYLNKVLAWFNIATILYASPPVQKLHLHSDIIFKLYKPIFYGGHLSCNTSYGGTATIQVFRLLQWRYSYSTQSSITELPLSVSQHWNPEHLL